MFYLESYSCTMYKNNPEIVEKFDFFIGTLFGDVTEKITPSLVVNKLKIHFEVAKQLLYYYESKNILKRLYAIMCPNEECRHVLKIVSKEELESELEDLKNIDFCYECNNNFAPIKDTDIAILFKRVKLNTVSQDEVNETLIKHNVIEKELKQNDFFIKADSLSIEDAFSSFYYLSESAKSNFLSRIEDITSDKIYDSNTEKGNELEKLCFDLLSAVKIFEVSRQYRTTTNQLDITVKLPIRFTMPTVLDDLGPYFICECKNEKKVSGNTYFHKLYSILEGTDGKVGILFSVSACAKTCKQIAHDKYLLSNKKIKLINITKNDLKQAVESDINLLELIKEKIDALTLNAEHGLRDKGFDC